MIIGVNEFYRDLGGRLRQARGPLSQTEVARRADLSRMNVANIELGRQRVAVDVLVRLAQAIDIDPLELLPPGAPGADATARLRPSERSAVERVRLRAGLVRDGDNGSG
jgi:transcriptional regulator with XRE-family HTH domain